MKLVAGTGRQRISHLTATLGNANRWDIALVSSQAICAICLWGMLVGSALPLIFRRLGFEPAIASRAFVATFADGTAIVICFQIAALYVL